MSESGIGILAYGSLIDNSGPEIGPNINRKIQCLTPFKVEFARTSSSRSGEPTLIPYDKGKKVNAYILVLNNHIDLDTAKSMLWRRERNLCDGKDYAEPISPSNNNVLVKTVKNFEGIDTVLYTHIGKNIDGEITADVLCDLGIDSILGTAGEEMRDGIRYLLDAKRNSITTLLSGAYEELVLKKTETKTLQEAIIKLDLQRNSQGNNRG
ncbi:hypothetical protein [Sphingobacterium sp.]|uniref:hypothetical protein n=1 Tax=Sphingobacterium sp. TaxID=341027 RepID=UPI00289E7657|nr:hypothetical protein [Sphingobacterium sp.]